LALHKSNSKTNKNLIALQNKRIIQYNLVYVIGLSEDIAYEDTLEKLEYMGQYGKITKLSINKSKVYSPNSYNGPSYSAYIMYSSKKEASLAVLALENVQVAGHLIKSSFGTTKYCNIFLQNGTCKNKECLYLHKISDDDITINKDEISNDKNLQSEHLKSAIKFADLLSSKTKKSLLSSNVKDSIFPNIEEIYNTPIVQDLEKSQLPYSDKKSSTNKAKESKISSNENQNDNLDVIKPTKDDADLQRSMSSTTNSNNSSAEFGFMTNHALKEIAIPKNKIFINKDKSRFKFTEEIIEDKESVEVHDHISQILNKKLAKYCFYKNRSPCCSELDTGLYIEKNKNSEWMTDIKSYFVKNTPFDG